MRSLTYAHTRSRPSRYGQSKISATTIAEGNNTQTPPWIPLPNSALQRSPLPLADIFFLSSALMLGHHDPFYTHAYIWCARTHTHTRTHTITSCPSFCSFSFLPFFSRLAFSAAHVFSSTPSSLYTQMRSHTQIQTHASVREHTQTRVSLIHGGDSSQLVANLLHFTFLFFRSLFCSSVSFSLRCLVVACNRGGSSAHLRLPAYTYICRNRWKERRKEQNNPSKAEIAGGDPGVVLVK